MSFLYKTVFGDKEARNIISISAHYLYSLASCKVPSMGIWYIKASRRTIVQSISATNQVIQYHTIASVVEAIHSRKKRNIVRTRSGFAYSDRSQVYPAFTDPTMTCSLLSGLVLVPPILLALTLSTRYEGRKHEFIPYSHPVCVAGLLCDTLVLLRIKAEKRTTEPPGSSAEVHHWKPTPVDSTRTLAEVHLMVEDLW